MPREETCVLYLLTVSASPGQGWTLGPPQMWFVRDWVVGVDIAIMRHIEAADVTGCCADGDGWQSGCVPVSLPCSNRDLVRLLSPII